MPNRLYSLGFRFPLLCLCLVALFFILSPYARHEPAPSGFVQLEGEHEVSVKGMFVDLAQTVEERDKFRQEYYATNNKRELYEKYIGRIGANGIGAALHEINPACHSEAHDLGRAVFSRLGEIGPSLRACGDICFSGCMHGVMMEAFINATPTDPEGHFVIRDIAPLLPTTCLNESVAGSNKPGDCAHGVGHAIMFMSGYNITAAIDACAGFGSKPMEYYCATGGYMEYAESHRDVSDDSPFYPCDRSKYPSACFRYRLVDVAMHFGGTTKETAEALAQKCTELEGFYRLGCFHGIGNAYVRSIYQGSQPIAVVCGFGDDKDRAACIDGAIERLSKYYGKESALRACEDLSGQDKALCDEGAERGMYSLEKDFSLYFD